MNSYPNKEDKSIYIKMYRYCSYLKNSKKVIIELEMNPNNICVLSFYEHKVGKVEGNHRYKIRTNLTWGQTKDRFKACLNVFLGLENMHALVFRGANDINKMEDLNPRSSAYQLFLKNYLPNFDDYEYKGSITYNTFIIYHKDYPNKSHANKFYESFLEKAMAEHILEKEKLIKE